ncbi:hypothetical protein ACFZBU_43460 [Embleya sp. NPDC008237]|uniref:hypothetical protein n=1 Tax=Embleya sp. NPDC008237 TaxID=3363978 RepID=UPI0036E97097
MNDLPAFAATEDRAALRRRLADDLTDGGDVRRAAWRVALESVPREVFVPEWFERVDTGRGTMWTPVTGKPRRWSGCTRTRRW